MFELFLPDLDLSFLFCGLALTDFSLHTVWSRTFISPAKYLWGNNLEFFRSSGYLYLFISSCSLHCLCCWLSMSCVSLSPVRCSNIIYGVFVNVQAECLGMFGVFPWSWAVFWQLVNATEPPEATAPYLPFLHHLADLWWLFCRQGCDWQSQFQNVDSSVYLKFVGFVQTK